MSTPLGTFGPPPDVAAWIALAASLVLFALAIAGRPRKVERAGLAVVALGICAALLSAAYIELYLRGGPRIIDATSYALQGRALAHGYFAFPIPEPSGSFRGRFLLSPDAGGSLSVIFPPGYPLLLALGFLVGAPLLIGPIIAAALVVATWALSRRLFDSKSIALVAAALSVASAALRYHTADTMSHGLAALLVAGALYFALADSKRAALAAGLCCGWLVLTRPVTGMVIGAVVGGLCLRPGRRLFLVVLGSLPGLALLAADQWQSVGQLGSSQLAYYALADGPPGCFRYGFGETVGCRVEHGDFVRARLEAGYGLWEAVGTTGRRLKMHLTDAANAEPFFVVLLAALVVGARRRELRLLAIVIVGVVLAYAPFYFDGNYPGAGARFYADILPLEHVAIAWVLARWRVAAFAVPVSLFGFAVHTSYDHRQLAEREGGRPMFEPGMLDEAGITEGLVFVETDHGFNLGHRPGAHLRGGEVVVARRRSDAHDRALWEELGRPRSYFYEYPVAEAGALPVVRPYEPPPSSRFEAEAEWPPLEVRHGWVRPAFPACASGKKGLSIERFGSESTVVTLEVFVPDSARFELDFGFASPGADVELVIGKARWVLSHHSEKPCWSWLSPPVALGAGAHRLVIFARGWGTTLDYVEVHRSPGQGGKKR